MVFVFTGLSVHRTQIFEISDRFSQCDHFDVPRGQPDVFNLYCSILSANTVLDTINW